ncbi:MAG: bifunctional DNA-binding transcriptional regulator/O6-methylguanine-DNA methyltransferase Ada [Acidobacteriaceae bacterium]
MATSTFTLAPLNPMPSHKPTRKPNRPSPPSVFAGRAWQQVLARDAAADGQFVYAVKSTGIYCRPSCSSRKPDRKNVSFFPTPALAEAAGFRPCLRCEPLRTTPKPDPQAEAIRKAADYLSEHSAQRTSLDDLAAASGLGKFALQRGFKRVLGVTPGDFAREQRKDRFRNNVRKPSLSITDAVYESGFSSSSRLYESSTQTLGMTPTAMKSGGAGETIHYATTDSPLGRLLVATTPRGLCAVLFADSDTDPDADLVLQLRERFPQAVLRPAPSTPDQPGDLTEALQFVHSQLTEHPSAQTLPFHVRATAFQQRVWQALLQIPRGETRTYSQIAESIGSPKAVRAVGTACGSNLLAVVVPCHRVVGSDGRLTGYRWGTDRKRQLLDLERRP